MSDASFQAMCFREKNLLIRPRYKEPPSTHVVVRGRMHISKVGNQASPSPPQWLLKPTELTGFRTLVDKQATLAVPHELCSTRQDAGLPIAEAL